MPQTDLLDYQYQDQTFEAFIAAPSFNRPRPAVLICHAWAGRGDHEEEIAKKLAELGFVGIALDVYGKGKRGHDNAECEALMTPLVQDRGLLQARLMAAIEAVQKLDYVQSDHLAMCGYCFGGLCVLDMARAGAPVKGVAAFHGILGAPDNLKDKEIEAKVMIYHGYDDPLATPKDLVTFADEMTKVKADWQALVFGGTLHAFTNKQANDPTFGTVYSEAADHRSWRNFLEFLDEVLR